jgi:hypothetical protein
VTTGCHDWQQNTVYGACATEAPGSCTESILAAALEPLNNKNANTSLDGLLAAYDGCTCTYRWMGGSAFEVTYAQGGGNDLIVIADM